MPHASRLHTALQSRSKPDGAIRLRLEGESDIAALPGLDATLQQAQSPRNHAVTDLRRQVFLDCTCLQTLPVADAARGGPASG